MCAYVCVWCLVYEIGISINNLCLQLWTKNIIDVYFFLLLNVLLVFYSFLQGKFNINHSFN